MTTTASRPRRLLLCLLVVATLATAAYATTASAAATPVPIYNQTTVVGPAQDPQPCTGVVGGMLSAAVLGVLLIPVCFVALRRLMGDPLDEPGRAEIDSVRPGGNP